MNSNDNLPKMICKCCVEQLNAAYEFRMLVINSDYKLRNAIKDLENLNDSGEWTEIWWHTENDIHLVWQKFSPMKFLKYLCIQPTTRLWQSEQIQQNQLYKMTMSRVLESSNWAKRSKSKRIWWKIWCANIVAKNSTKVISCLCILGHIPVSYIVAKS